VGRPERLRWRVPFLLLVASLPLHGQVEKEPDPVSPPRDPRTVIVVRENCTSRLAIQDLTLFANGTLRLRQGEVATPTMILHELTPDRLRQYVDRLARVELGDAEANASGPQASWDEVCTLELELPGREPRRFRYERLAAGDYGTIGVRRIVEDLLDEIEESASPSEIPASYRPRTGDRLERNDGVVFEVDGMTTDNKGVQLTSVDGRFTMFVPLERVPWEFRRFVLEP
jgi:hypothetical protein